ncbi:phosphatase PAP2 family protein [Kribbella sp. NPDC026596]|uniref:phosphatase PAP2 family protein n=1 Tax=Kribbella sp. NPDC026596 TaxID=3155122 RepID=UPI0033F84F54
MLEGVLMVAEGETSMLRRAGRAQQVAREVTVIAAAIVLYFGVRGLIATRVEVAYRNAESVIALERWSGVFVEPKLQAAVTAHGWIANTVSYIYIYGHWPVLLTTLLWLLIRHRDAYPTFRNAMLLSGAIGLVIFTVFPVAPPRFMAAYGFVDTVTKETEAYRVLQPPAFVNQYAAMPSLHFGWNLLMGIAVAGLAGHRLVRLLGWLMPVLMLAAIVLTANHYLFDGLAGGLIALVSLFAVNRLGSAGRRRRRGRRPAGSGALGPAVRLRREVWWR